MREDRRTGGVDPDGQVVGEQLLDIGGQRSGAVAVGDCLVVGDHHEHVDPFVLESDAILQRAEQMPEMQLASRAIPGQDPGREHARCRSQDRLRLRHQEPFA